MSKLFCAWSLAALASLSPVVVWSPAALGQSSDPQASETPLFEPRPDASEQKILAALAEPTELVFVDQPLNDVVESLKERHSIEIQLDNKALADSGLGSDTPVTRNLTGIRLESALNLMLEEMDLTYVPRDEFLMITTKTAAENMLLVRFYPVGDLLDAEADEMTVGASDDYRRLKELISSLIAPTSWDEVGGPAFLQAVPVARALAISQTFECHREIERFFKSLRAVKQVRPAPDSRHAEEDVKDDETLYARVYRLPAEWTHRSGMGVGGGMGGMIGPAPAKAAAPAEEKAGDKLAPKEVRPQMGMGGMGGGVAVAASPPRAYPTAEELAEAVPAVIAPESWDISGGLGAIRPAGNALIVRQTRPVHREIVRLLEQLK